jgi:cell division protease FtsH
MPAETPPSPKPDSIKRSPLEAPPRARWPALAFVIASVAVMWFVRSGMQAAHGPTIDYSRFYDFVQTDAVSSVAIRGQDIDGDLKASKDIDGKSAKTFHTTMPRQDEELLPLLRTKQVKIWVLSEEPSFFVSLLGGVLPWVLILGVWFWLSRRGRNMPSLTGQLGGFLKSRTRKFEREAQVNVSFDDVAGSKNAKRDLQEVVGFLKEPERFQRLGGRVPRGVLLIGPPGTGKTLLARAVAGEAGVPFYSISAAEFIEMFVGVGAARVRDLFEEAKKNAPSIVFIDEIDAVGRSRGTGFGGGHDEREQTLNQLLSEMDGFARTDLTVVIAATNRPDVLDPALLRPGRFDRRVLVDRPEFDARLSILGVHTRHMPLSPDVELKAIARDTPGFSGADLANLANEAALGATRRGSDAVTAEDFSGAFEKIVLGDPRDAKLSPTEKQRVAVHESGHAVVAHFAEHAELPQRVSIIPRGMALGATQQSSPGDRHIMTQAELEARLRVLMGGYAAERVVLEDVSTGAENDLKEATRLATKMVANFGMSKKMGAVYYEHQDEHPFLGQRIATDSGTSDSTAATLEEEARAFLTNALAGSTGLIEKHRDVLDRLVCALLEKETIEKSELTDLLNDNRRANDVAPAPVEHPIHPVRGAAQ